MTIEKSILDSLYYLLEKLDEPVDKVKAIKLVYFADRYHLRKYARFITNDTYFAMPQGVVGSKTKDILTDVLEEDKFSDFFVLTGKKHFFKHNPEKEVIFDSLSKTDIEALDFIIKEIGHLNSKQLSNLSHNYPEWLRHERDLKSKNKKRADIEFTDFFSTDYTPKHGFKNDIFTVIPTEIVDYSKDECFCG